MGNGRIALSDGETYCQGILMSSLTTAFEDGQVPLYSIFRTKKLTVTYLKNKRVALLSDIDMNSVVQCGGVVGSPVLLVADEPNQNFQINQPPNQNEPIKNEPFNTEEPSSVQTISSLSPYNTRWIIKARVTNKTEIKKWTNAKGEGRLFSATLVDSSGEIRVTAFNDAVDKFFDLFEVGKILTVSHASCKIAKRQFNSVNNDYEIHLESNSVIERCGEAADVPSVRYSFTPIKSIASSEKDALVDVIGVVTNVGEVSSITTKTTGKQLSKRDVSLTDTSKCAIRLTLWGAFAESPLEPGTVLAIKGAKVSDYNGRTLSALSSSQITLNPDLPAAFSLRGWYDAQGRYEEPTPLTVAGSGATRPDDRKTIAQARDEQMGSGDKADYYSVVAAISYIKSDALISYPACPTEGCNKKVIEEGPQMYRCERCQKHYPRCDHRYILSLQISDATGQTWVSAFNETGEQILGTSAESLYYLKSSDETAYQQVFMNALFKEYLFRLKAKQEVYNNESKLRVQVVSAVPLNYSEEANKLADQIESFHRQ